MGLSQTAFADLIGAKRNTISDYERGRSNPSIELVRKMVSLFSTNLNDLIEKDMSQYSTQLKEEEKVNLLEEAGASYQIKGKLTKVELLENEIQQLKLELESKDKELSYLKEVLEAKNQSIQNLKKLIDYLEQSNK